MQRCKNAKFLMESNSDGTYLDGWGMSIATQRAKERENRTPDVKVMGKTVKHGRLISQGSDIRGWVRISGGQCPEPCRFGAPGAGSPAWGPDVRPDGPDVRPEARMSGPTIPDRDLDFETRFGGGNR